MRQFAIMLLLFVGSLAASAQPPERVAAELSDADSTVMSILDRYAVSSLQAVDVWQPSVPAVKWRHIEENAGSSMLPIAVDMKVKLPKPVDMSRLVWKPSSSVSIIISNGNAANYMPWPNAPIGYLDARTLSFPLPR